MPVEWQTLSIPFIGGVNQKTDAKALPPPKLSKLENATFSRDGALRKRSGSTAFSTTVISSSFPQTLQTCRALGAYDDELLYWTDHFLISYTQTGGAWRYRGGMESWVVTTAKPQKVTGEQTAADRATNLGLTVYAWEDSRGGVRFSAVDSQSGLIYTADSSLDASGSRPRVVAVGTQIHLYWINGGNLKLSLIDPVLYTASLSGAGSYPTAAVTVVAVGANFYDVSATPSQVAVGYCTAANSFAVQQVNAVGTNGINSGAIAAGGNVTAIGVATATTTIGVVVATNAGANSVTGYGFIAPTLAGSGTAVVDTGAATWNAITLAPKPTTTVSPTTVTFHVYYEQNAAAAYNRIVWSGQFDVNNSTGATSGGSGGSLLRRHSALASRAWAETAQEAAPSYTFVHVTQETTLQSTYFAYRSDRTVCARVLAGNAGGVPARNVLPQVESLGSRRYAWAGIYKTRLDVTRTVTTNPAVYTEKGIQSITYDFNNAQSHRQARKGKAQYISGGILWQYDGLAPVEQGFLMFPENVTTTPAAGGSMTVAVPYTYTVYAEWTNAKGERELSTIGAAVTLTMGGADTQVTLTIPTIAHTMKSGQISSFPRREISFAVYRTKNTPTDQSPRYRVSDPNPTTAGANNGYVVNDPTVDTVTFVDQLADTAIDVKEIDYQSTGEVENLSAPSVSILATYQDRLVAAGLEDGSMGLYSKEWGSDGGVSFTGRNAIEWPDEGGSLTAFGILNGNLIGFKRSRIYAVAGDGLSNTGQGQQFGTPSLLVADVGCSNQSSVVITPFGLMFQSAKGIYLLNLSMQVEPIGAELGDTLGLQQIEAATLMPDRFEVRFLCSSGSTLVFNYYAKQWSVFTFTGVDACLWHGTTYVYASGSTAYQESAAVFQDAGVNYSVALETGDVHAGPSLQSWGIFREVVLLGEYKADHTLRVSFLYNAVGTFSETHDIVISGAPSDGYEYRVCPSQPDRHFSLRVRVEDRGSNAGESFILNEMAVVVGPLNRVAKVPASKSA